ncbi:hypothetical protein [Vannielia litorea]|uniref:Uncharacterized protein n=1 Tax=Vannielia litorea TaxID=1217970 RepID=A0A1N6FM39_9RHOB|nr:hypothetical protein [Vannielia litorea]SIN96250.1 hypothetical protein SAMN05444002_1778 [Vannielia litorea]
MYLVKSVTKFSLALGLGLAALSATPASAAKCTAFSAVGMSSAPEICGCTVVTQGFLRSVSRKDNFGTLLGAMEQSCPALAQLVTDLPTAAAVPTIRNPPSGRSVQVAEAPAEEVDEEYEDENGYCEPGDRKQKEVRESRRSEKQSRKRSKSKNRSEGRKKRGSKSGRSEQQVD